MKIKLVFFTGAINVTQGHADIFVARRKHRTDGAMPGATDAALFLGAPAQRKPGIISMRYASDRWR
jgi:hypothetical protein